jgi:predicted ATPase
MFGGVGCGKTMLMDAFAESCPREFAVRRAHYHDFMLDVHSRLRLFKGERDPLARVADAVAAQCRVLCLDELFVTDVADAMILGRLFGRLWDDGLVLVATSNRAPTSLYEGGLQRQLFLPFIERLQRRCVVHDMASGVDYRRLAHHARGTYFVAPDRDAALAEAFARAAVEEDKAARDARAVAAAAATRGGGSSAAAAAAPSSSSSSSELPPALGSPSPVDIPVAMGRLLHVPRAAGRACLFHFDELCGQPVAAADYLALAERFDAVALQGIPVFTGANVASGHRFVTLVDILYENRTRLLASAEAPPFALFENVVTRAEARERSEKRRKERELGGGGGFGDNGSGTSFSSSEQQQQQQNEVVDESLGFSKDRAVSRLTEMQSAEYAAAHLEVLARRARGEPAVPHKQ